MDSYGARVNNGMHTDGKKLAYFSTGDACRSMENERMKTIVTMAICMVSFMSMSCARKSQNAIQDLPEWKGKTIQQMIKELGRPTEETSYTMGQAPTKGWNHGIIFSVYPTNKSENQGVVIKEYAWEQGDFKIRACCHVVKKAWLVMGAKKIHKNVKF